MAATAVPLLPFDVWPAGITQAATPANDNALRAEVIARDALSFEAAQPSLSSPSDDGSLYILSASWGEEVTGTLAFFTDDTWYYFIPYEGMVKRVGAVFNEYTAGAWQIYAPGGGVDSVNGATGDVTVLQPIGIAVGDETSDLTTGAGKVGFRVPYAMTLTEVRASVRNAPTGDDLIVDINKNGSTILSAKLQIDDGDTTSTTSSAPAVISDDSLADDDEITIDIDQIGSSNAGAGLKVWLIGYAP